MNSAPATPLPVHGAAAASPTFSTAVAKDVHARHEHFTAAFIGPNHVASGSYPERLKLSKSALLIIQQYPERTRPAARQTRATPARRDPGGRGGGIRGH